MFLSSYLNFFLHQDFPHTASLQNPSSKPGFTRTDPGNFTEHTVRYRKGVYSALWVQVALIVCYLPHFLAEIYIDQKGMNSSVYYAAQLTVTLVFLNSSLHPILYCWKIGEVREAVKNTLRQRFCASS